MLLRLTNTLVATILMLICSAALANEQNKSTSELYDGLLPKEQSALCAVSAMMIEPKDEQCPNYTLKILEREQTSFLFSLMVCLSRWGRNGLLITAIQTEFLMFMRYAKARSLFGPCS
jgi:hypothetical protein